uniref:Uncharacterized protein n=1 Tax=Candidatus Magnetananas rongchengensis TaxID=1463558 RepID=A0A3S6IXW2_9BACT|nr:hypothetical protein [Candidatus Magnetananas rongchenensis]
MPFHQADWVQIFFATIVADACDPCGQLGYNQPPFSSSASIFCIFSST